MSGLSLHEDSVSSGFEPETPTSFYTQRTHAEGSQDESYDSLFGDDSGLGSVRTNNASNEQDETPLIEDLSNCSYNPRWIFCFKNFLHFKRKVFLILQYSYLIQICKCCFSRANIITGSNS